MTILGLNAYHGDSAACLFVDGKLIAAAEEERFRRIKHWAGLPTQAIDYCLREGGLTISEIDHIAVNRKPGVNNLRRFLFVLRHRPDPRLMWQKVRNIRKAATRQRGARSALRHKFARGITSHRASSRAFGFGLSCLRFRGGSLLVRRWLWRFCQHLIRTRPC